MKFSIRVTLICCLLFVTHLCATETVSETNEAMQGTDSVLNIDEATLDNGLKVVVWNKKTHGVIFAAICYYVGSGDDPRNVVGISHVLEHMMFKGTKNLSGADLKSLVFIGDTFSNAFTGYDATCFVHNCSKEFLDVDLAIEADRMVNLKLNPQDLEKEKEVIIEERKLRMESDPITNHMLESALKSMYFFSNYSYPIIGYLDQIKACDEREVVKHYERFYKPNNAFILLVGDITLDEALNKVKKHFGNIKKGRDHERTRVIDPTDTGLFHTLEHKAPDISIHNLNLIFDIDRSLFDSVEKLLTVTMAIDILSSGPSSILFQNMVDRKNISYSTESETDIRAFDKGRVNVATIFRENQNDKDIEREMTSIIYNYVDKYLTRELFENEKVKLLDRIELMEDNPQDLGFYVLEFLINGYSIDEVKNVKKIIQKIKFEDVQDVARRIFRKDNMTLRVYSHPKEG